MKNIIINITERVYLTPDEDEIFGCIFEGNFRKIKLNLFNVNETKFVNYNGKSYCRNNLIKIFNSLFKKELIYFDLVEEPSSYFITKLTRKGLKVWEAREKQTHENI